LQTAHVRMTSVRAAHTPVLVFTPNCHKSALPHFAGTIMPRTWQFAIQWSPNRRSGKRTWFLHCYIAKEYLQFAQIRLGIRIRISSDQDPWKC
jgi:hypothetical protein